MIIYCVWLMMLAILQLGIHVRTTLEPHTYPTNPYYSPIFTPFALTEWNFRYLVSSEGCLWSMQSLWCLAIASRSQTLWESRIGYDCDHWWTLACEICCGYQHPRGLSERDPPHSVWELMFYWEGPVLSCQCSPYAQWSLTLICESNDGFHGLSGVVSSQLHHRRDTGRRNKINLHFSFIAH